MIAEQEITKKNPCQNGPFKKKDKKVVKCFNRRRRKCSEAPRTAAFCTNSIEWREVPAQEISEDLY